MHHPSTNAMMNGRLRGKHLGPALSLIVLALFYFAPPVAGQSLKDMPPPPPVPLFKPKPTPTPAPPKDEDFEVIRTSSNLILVPVSVVDANREAVHGLQVGDFRIEELGRQQEIAQIGDPEQVPLDIALVFDVSSSVSQKGFFAFQQQAAATFLKSVLKSMDRAAVFTITDQPRLIQPLSSAEVAAAKVLTIPAATTPVATSFYDTVAAAATYLVANSPQQNRRVVVVISDGDDNNSKLVRDMSAAEARARMRGELTPASALQGLQERHRRAVADVQKAVQQADATFYSVNPGGSSVWLNVIARRAQENMQSIAQATGGTAFLPDSASDLQKVFNEVAAELRGQYLLLYYSNSQTPPGEFRSIKVSVPAHPEAHVRAKQGYYPKGK
jgi:Ca-activated chloride channel family protein